MQVQGAGPVPALLVVLVMLQAPVALAPLVLLALGLAPTRPLVRVPPAPALPARRTWPSCRPSWPR